MTLNTMEFDGFTAVIQYNPETDAFRGEIQGLNGGADFYGRTPGELRKQFRASLDFFLKTAKQRGLPIRKQLSGRFNLRIAPELHAKAATVAKAEGVSLNAFVEHAISEQVASHR